ncbi:transcription antitermination factor NusB [Tindallia californiensis]|uniref:Transcription antitermination protein NusB n=1 Tax=Tindallia californiensis TaxID=159292 RepID=A0A1H3NK93_9FIRM|nr:transcription antitermination factor NusB [Tindallia californiensis]SDY89100.1 NusB antitermination factor [Tindallia californiensis]
MKRTQARELCIQLAYEMIIKDEYSLDGFEVYQNENFDDDISQQTYVIDVLNLVIEKRESIDKIIRSYSKDWDFERIARVDLAILRVGLSELLFMENIPHHVTINEAVELAKKFGTEQSPSFINGILGRYHREYQGQDGSLL